MNLCTVKNKNGYQILFMPNGEQVPGVRLTKVTQTRKMKGYAEVMVKLIVNIDD